MPGFILNSDERNEYYFKEGCYILELLNTSRDEEISIARARVPVGVTTKKHSLRGITERYLILQGEGNVTIDQQHTKPVCVGDVVYIAAGSSQKIQNSGSVDLIFLAICTPRFKPTVYQDQEIQTP